MSALKKVYLLLILLDLTPASTGSQSKYFAYNSIPANEQSTITAIIPNMLITKHLQQHSLNFSLTEIFLKIFQPLLSRFP
jgi:hypothetical protein